MWWIYRLIVAVTFVSFLIANLAVSKSVMPFNTLDELVQQNTYRWATLGNAFLQTTFQNSNLTLYQRIWKEIDRFSEDDPRVLAGDIETRLNKVANEQYAFFGTVPSWESRGYDSCDFVKLREEFFANRYAFSLPKNSPLTARFSLGIIRLEDSGYLNVKRKEWFSKSSSGACDDRNDKRATAISMDDVRDVFIVSGAGLALVSIVFTAELILAKLWFKER